MKLENSADLKIQRLFPAGVRKIILKGSAKNNGINSLIFGGNNVKKKISRYCSKYSGKFWPAIGNTEVISVGYQPTIFFFWSTKVFICRVILRYEKLFEGVFRGK